MQVIFKYLSQFILLPLIKELIAYVVFQVKSAKENKKQKEENKKREDEYKKASAADAHDAFSRLP